MAEATGELLLLANPDIEFLDGSVASLVQAVEDGADVVGPQLLWDREGDILLPIPEDPRPAAELARTLRRRRTGLRGVGQILDASWRVWTATQPCEVPSLRGPLLALKRDTARRLGPLDEGYFLYYEETDWLRCAQRRGARLKLAPGARVVHRWGHATRRLDGRVEIEERSRARFFERHYSRTARTLLRRLAPQDQPSDTGFESVAGPDAIPDITADAWLISIVSHMQPSVGSLRSSWPTAASELTATGRWYAVAARRKNGRWRLPGSWMWEIR
jgi:hypothetical protein